MATSAFSESGSAIERVTSMRPSIRENIWTNKSNKKSVNGRKLWNDRVVCFEDPSIKLIAIVLVSSHRCVNNFLNKFIN